MNIKITNEMVFALMTESPAETSFRKLMELVGISGRLQYWTYRLYGDISAIWKTIEKTRQQLAVQFADKDESGQPVKKENRYVIAPESVQGFNEEFIALMKESNELSYGKIAISHDLMERMNAGKPLDKQFLVGDMVMLGDFYEFTIPE